MLLPTGRSSSPNGLSATSSENPQPPHDGQDVTLGNGRRFSVSSTPPQSPDPCEDLGAFFEMAENTGGSEPRQQNETHWGIRPHHHHSHHHHGHHHHSRHSRGHQRSHRSHHQHTHQPNPEELIIVERDGGKTETMTMQQFEERYDPDGRGRFPIKFIYRRDANGVMHAMTESRFKAEHAGSNITETG